MRKPGFGIGVLFGLLFTAAALGVLYLGASFGLPFVPFDLFDWVTRSLPGPVVTAGIDGMIAALTALGISVADTAKTAEQAMAAAGTGLFGALMGGLFFAALSRGSQRPTIAPGVLLGALFGAAAIAIHQIISQSVLPLILRAVWIGVVFLAWGAALGLAARKLWPDEGVSAAPEGERLTLTQQSRRRFLIQAGAAAAAITILGAGVGAAVRTSTRRPEEQASGEPLDLSSLPNADDPVKPAPGTRSEVTRVSDHYRVFIRTEPSRVDGATWTLPIVGMVDTPLELSLDDLRQRFEPLDQWVTLACISNPVGGTLIGTTRWTGCSLRDVLAEAGVRPGARYLNIESSDGFHESLQISLAEMDPQIMLTYDWDGQPLPFDHGFPLRIYIPNRYGMKQPKWITRIEVSDEQRTGYWVERSWDEKAIMLATSVIDTIAVNDAFEQDGQTLIPVGGIAHAGARGISRVEVSVDGGDWVEAQLRAPLSETTWVIWRYDWPFTPGEHTLAVRCFEADGTPQIAEERDARPAGATGLHSRSQSV